MPAACVHFSKARLIILRGSFCPGFPSRLASLIVAFVLAACAPLRIGHETVAAPEAAAQIDHVSLHVSNVERSASFYRDIFFLPEIASPVRGLRWLLLGSGAQLHLLPGRKEPVVEDRAVHLALSVQDLDRFLATLRAREISWTDFAGTPGAVSKRSDGVRQIYLRDPDSYWIEVNDRLHFMGFEFPQSFALQPPKRRLR